MTHRTDKEQMAADTDDRTKESGKMNSGTPNPEGSEKERSAEHEGSYGGERGAPRVSSDKRANPADGEMDE